MLTASLLIAVGCAPWADARRGTISSLELAQRLVGMGPRGPVDGRRPKALLIAVDGLGGEALEDEVAAARLVQLDELDAGRTDVQPDHGRVLAAQQCVEESQVACSSARDWRRRWWGKAPDTNPELVKKLLQC